MAKYYGNIGFSLMVDKGHGVFKKEITEHSYYGDINRRTFRYANGTGINDDINIVNEISIVCDDFIICNTHNISYITINGAKWKVSSIEQSYPRLNITTGGLYNESV